VLKIEFTAEVSDGHGNFGSQPVAVTLVGANNTTNVSAFSTVNGTSGNDTFSNVGGNVTIFGGNGQDTFVFNPGFGKAVIADFDVNNDKIEISKALFGTVGDVLAAATPANAGHDVVITDAAHDTITLKGLTVAQLQAFDFHLF
jgi:Ca2+-binding RTX toxin-like protein